MSHISNFYNGRRENSSFRNALTWSPTIAEVSRGRDNNFNLVRFIAASMVILFHEYVNRADTRRH